MEILSPKTAGITIDLDQTGERPLASLSGNDKGGGGGGGAERINASKAAACTVGGMSGLVGNTKSG